MFVIVVLILFAYDFEITTRRIETFTFAEKQDDYDTLTECLFAVFQHKLFSKVLSMSMVFVHDDGFCPWGHCFT